MPQLETDIHWLLLVYVLKRSLNWSFFSCSYLLQRDYSFLGDINVWPPMVTVGIYSSAMSAAMSSLIGASRILYALSKDNLFGEILTYKKLLQMMHRLLFRLPTFPGRHWGVPRRNNLRSVSLVCLLRIGRLIWTAYEWHFCQMSKPTPLARLIVEECQLCFEFSQMADLYSLNLRVLLCKGSSKSLILFNLLATTQEIHWELCPQTLSWLDGLV